MFQSSFDSAPVADRLRQCDTRIAVIRARIDAINRASVLRAQMLHNERTRNIVGQHMPQPDWIATLEAQRAADQTELREQHAELIGLLAARNALLLAEQQ